MTIPAKSIGDQELALLTYLAERGGATVGEVAEGFGTPRGLARSTVLTMMERLRQKKHLVRKRDHGVYRYVSPATRGDVLRDVVGSFVERTLGGSVSPFVAYLTESADVTDDDLAELETLVRTLQKRKKTP
jgi:predicted transcriptional regulator